LNKSNITYKVFKAYAKTESLDFQESRDTTEKYFDLQAKCIHFGLISTKLTSFLGYERRESVRYGFSGNFLE
jgi:hypothetical protein